MPDRVTQLEEAVKNLLAHIDSEEVKAAWMLAWVHGFRVDPRVAERNGKMIEEAYALVGMERPK